MEQSETTDQLERRGEDIGRRCGNEHQLAGVSRRDVGLVESQEVLHAGVLLAGQQRLALHAQELHRASQQIREPVRLGRAEAVRQPDRCGEGPRCPEHPVPGGRRNVVQNPELGSQARVRLDVEPPVGLAVAVAGKAALVVIHLVAEGAELVVLALGDHLPPGRLIAIGHVLLRPSPGPFARHGS